MSNVLCDGIILRLGKKMKALVSCVTVLALAFALSGCNGGQSNTTAGSTSAEDGATSQSAETVEVDNAWYRDNPYAMTQGVYLVGSDLAAGNYIFTCDDDEYTGYVIVFNSVDNYVAYHTASRFTNGEESAAVEANAAFSEYLNEGDSLNLSLQEGSVLLVEARGTLSPAEGENGEATQVVSGNPVRMVDGIYDSNQLGAGTYVLSSTEENGGFDVVVFENKEAYDAFENAGHSTNGEWGAAVEQNAWSDFYLNPGDSCYLNLSDDSIAMIEGGEGVAESVSMGWAL